MNIGIVGISGYGGAELLRLCSAHPSFHVSYASDESTVGQTLHERFPALAGTRVGELMIQPFDPEKLDGIDVLFASLPTGKSREPLSRVDSRIRIVDVGGDHRFVEGWVYGLTELPGQREQIRGCTRLANPGCYPAASLLVLAWLCHQSARASPRATVVAAFAIAAATRVSGVSARVKIPAVSVGMVMAIGISSR